MVTSTKPDFPPQGGRGFLLCLHNLVVINGLDPSAVQCTKPRPDYSAWLQLVMDPGFRSC